MKSQWSSSCQSQMAARTLRNLENLEELCVMRRKRGEIRDVNSNLQKAVLEGRALFFWQRKKQQVEE